MNKKGIRAECPEYGTRSYISRLQYQARHSSNLDAHEEGASKKEETLQGLVQGFLVTHLLDGPAGGIVCRGCAGGARRNPEMMQCSFVVIYGTRVNAAD